MNVEDYAASRFGLQGKRCLVTGGTRGIGKAIVEEFGKLGAVVFTCARTEQHLQDRLKEWTELGLSVQGVVADLSDRLQREALVTKTADVFGGQLDILINNVGTNIRKPTIQYTEQDYQAVMSTNLDSAYHLCQLVHPLLKAAGGGVIVMNSSVAGGPTALRSGSIYAMTKAALNQLTKNLACEWAQDGIRVNSVAPWYTATDLANQVLQNEQVRQDVLARTPMKRIATPEEVAAVMAFFCSPAAAFVTGQTLAVDGGYSVMGMF